MTASDSAIATTMCLQAVAAVARSGAGNRASSCAQEKPGPGSCLRPGAMCSWPARWASGYWAASCSQQPRQGAVLRGAKGCALQPFELDADRVVIAVAAPAPGRSAGMPGARSSALTNCHTMPWRVMKKWADTSRPRMLSKYGWAAQSSWLVNSCCTQPVPYWPGGRLMECSTARSMQAPAGRGPKLGRAGAVRGGRKANLGANGRWGLAWASAAVGWGRGEVQPLQTVLNFGVGSNPRRAAAAVISPPWVCRVWASSWRSGHPARPRRRVFWAGDVLAWGL